MMQNGNLSITVYLQVLQPYCFLLQSFIPNLGSPYCLFQKSNLVPRKIYALAFLDFFLGNHLEGCQI